MILPKFNNLGYKEKIKKLINIGLFDEHIDELSDALYTKRIFTKDIKAYFINNRKLSLNNYLTPKNKKVSDLKPKILDKHNEDEINDYMQKLLNSLNNSQEETDIKFKQLKEENDFFCSLFKINKELGKINSIKNNDLFLFLYDLLLKYKSNKNLEFDMNSLFSDVLKETPLATKDVDKLKFYYILNSDRFDDIDKDEKIHMKQKSKLNPLISMNNNEVNNFNKINSPKEPKVIDVTKIKNLKEIKFLNKVNKRTKHKIIIGGKIIGVNAHKPNQLEQNNSNFEANKKDNENLENSNEDDDLYNFQNFEDIIKEKNEKRIRMKEKRKQLKLEIEKDIKDINILKETIKNSFNNQEKNNFSNLINNDSNLAKKRKLIFHNKNKSDLDMNLNNNENKFNKIISLDNDNKNCTYTKKIKFRPIAKKDNLVKTISFDKFRTINDKNKNDIFIKRNFNSSLISNNNNYNSSFVSNKNNCQASTFYSNLSNINNNLSLSRFSLKSSKNTSNMLNTTPKKSDKFKSNNLTSTKNNKKVLFSHLPSKKFEKKKSFKKSKSIHPDAKRNELLNNILNNQTDEVYSISKSINRQNKLNNLNKINDYLKYKNSRLPLLFNGNNVKDNFFFLRRIKNDILNNGIRNKYQDFKKFLNDNDKKKINKINYLESKIIRKDNELLVKILNKKYK